MYTVDAGRNLTGWIQLITHGHPGDKIDMRYAETISTLWNNYRYSLTMNIVSHSAGLLFRAADEHNYYYWKFTTTGNILAYKRSNGILTLIKKIPFNANL